MALSHLPGKTLFGIYPAVEPYERGYLAVEGGHQVYWEACGNPAGRPALFLHGGPGGGCSPDHRRLFDPAYWRIILFDQRGCGRSRPKASIEHNTTAHLIADIERLRLLHAVEQWLVLGGSWGSTLALAYAQAHPDRVSALVLRGIFLAREREIDWLYRAGASSLYPESWERFRSFIAPDERDDLVRAYHRRVTQGDPDLQYAAAHAWCEWERGIMTLLPAPAPMATDPVNELALARLELHYFVHGSFTAKNQILDRIGQIASIPAVIVQGRHDCVTPAVSAWDLHKAWTGSRLKMVEDAGHATNEPGILSALIAATDAVREQS